MRSHHWKILDVILADDLPAEQVVDQINAQVRLNAAEAGEFVQRIRIGVAQPHSPGWQCWPAAYLPGPPGTFPNTAPERCFDTHLTD